MHEAHEYYRVVQSETFDLRLPGEGNVRVSRGPKTVLTPPTYTPPPKSQRINDAVADAIDAKNKLDEERGKIDQQILDGNNLRGEIEALAAQNQQLATAGECSFRHDWPSACGGREPHAGDSGGTSRRAGGGSACAMGTKGKYRAAVGGRFMADDLPDIRLRGDELIGEAALKDLLVIGDSRRLEEAQKRIDDHISRQSLAIENGTWPVSRPLPDYQKEPSYPVQEAVAAMVGVGFRGLSRTDHGGTECSAHA